MSYIYLQIPINWKNVRSHASISRKWFTSKQPLWDNITKQPKFFLITPPLLGSAFSNLFIIAAAAPVTAFPLSKLSSGKDLTNSITLELYVISQYCLYFTRGWNFGKGMNLSRWNYRHGMKISLDVAGRYPRIIL